MPTESHSQPNQPIGRRRLLDVLSFDKLANAAVILTFAGSVIWFLWDAYQYNATNRGGAREGAGRKPLPPSERRDQVFSVKLTKDEKQLLDETDAREWARTVLLTSARKRR